MSCTNKSIKYYNPKTKQFMIAPLTCKSLTCLSCMSIQRQEYKDVLTYLTNTHNLRCFFTLTTNLDYKSLQSEFTKIVTAHKVIKYDYFKKELLSKRKGRVVNVAMQYKTFIQNLIESEIKAIIYIKNFKYYHLKKEFKDGVSFKDFVDNTYLKYKEGTTKKDIKMYLKYFSEVLDKIRTINLDPFGFIFCRVLEYQENGNPHFHALTNGTFHSIVQKFSNKIYDIQTIPQSENGESAINYVLAYVTKDVLQQNAKCGDGKVQNIAFSRVQHNGELIGLVKYVKGILKLGITNDWEKLDVLDGVIHNIRDTYNSENECDSAIAEMHNFRQLPIIDMLDKETIRLNNAKWKNINLIKKLKQEKNNLNKSQKDTIEKIDVEIKKHLDFGKQMLDSYKEFMEKRFTKNLIELIQTKENEESSAFEQINSSPSYLTMGQAEFFNSFNNSNIITLNGYAGTGKTTVVRDVLENYNVNGKKIIFTALSGKAVMNMKDRYKGSKFLNNCNSEFKNIYELLKCNLNHYCLSPRVQSVDADLVVVDEVGMLNIQLVTVLLSVLNKGCKVIFLGDDKQLISIGSQNSALDVLKIHCKENYTLTEIKRSKDDIVNISTQIRNGSNQVLNKICEKFTEDKYKELQKQGYVFLTHTRKLKAKILGFDEKKDIPLFKSNSANYYLGDTIIIEKNYKNYNICNSEIYTVSGYKDNFATLVNSEKTVEVPVDFNLFSSANCLTVHKSQGSEFDNVCIVLDDKNLSLVNSNFLYTAITRAKSNIKILIDGDYNVVIKHLLSCQFVEKDVQNLDYYEFYWDCAFSVDIDNYTLDWENISSNFESVDLINTVKEILSLEKSEQLSIIA